jgi:hypothetical protein
MGQSANEACRTGDVVTWRLVVAGRLFFEPPISELEDKI